MEFVHTPKPIPVSFLKESYYAVNAYRFINAAGVGQYGRGIRVNAVSPGPITTPLLTKTGLSEAELKALADGILNQISTGRFGNPTEIAKAVVFLASDEAAFTVGSELVIDGGMSTL